MSVACGYNFTCAVTESGHLWTWGVNHEGQLGCGLFPPNLRGRIEQTLVPQFHGQPIVMVAAGHNHAACVTDDGALWTWGCGVWGQLGHGLLDNSGLPFRLGTHNFGGSRAVMVTCGSRHTLLLTAAGVVWSCGSGRSGGLGYHNPHEQLLLAQVPVLANIVMVAAGAQHSVALDDSGAVWTWGCGRHGGLGHGNTGDSSVPTRLAGCQFHTVLIAAAANYTMAVATDGALWAWGGNRYGQLGLGDIVDRLMPARVGAEETFAGSRVMMAACGEEAAMAVTVGGVLWSWGVRPYENLGHPPALVPTLVDPHPPVPGGAGVFGGAKIVSATVGHGHAAVVTECGALYTWGRGSMYPANVNPALHAPIACSALGFLDGRTRRVPSRLRIGPIMPLGARIGRCHEMPSDRGVAFAMCTHERLGTAAAQADAEDSEENGHANSDSAFHTMHGDLLIQLLVACRSWPPGRAGELEGIIRLVGGGLMVRSTGLLRAPAPA